MVTSCVGHSFLAEVFDLIHGNSYRPYGWNIPLGDLLRRSDRLHMVEVDLCIYTISVIGGASATPKDFTRGCNCLRHEFFPDKLLLK